LYIKKKYCVIARDAGGANQLSCWSKKKKKVINFSIVGPSKKFFFKRLGKFNNLNFKSAINNSEVVICGTGGGEYEKKAMLYAKQNNKKLIVWLDHWILYKKRLTFAKKKIIPHEIWVTDKHALKIAKKTFNCKIVLKPDYYYRSCSNKKKMKISNKLNLLYLLGRINAQGYKNNKFGKIEISAFKNFIKAANFIKKKTKILVRLHPSTKKEFLNKFISNNKIFDYSNKDLIEDLNYANYVFGANSASLYYALRLKKKVINCISSSKDLVLPFSNFLKLNEFIKNLND
jgi:hypothetical protein